MIRTYSELVKRSTLQERFEYLNLQGEVGDTTFGYDRYLNQNFYTSREWKQIRWFVITRDDGNDLGIADYPIHDSIIVHHMNPVMRSHIIDGDSSILDPEFLICVSHQTHNAIHYGDFTQLPSLSSERVPGDTRLW